MKLQGSKGNVILTFEADIRRILAGSPESEILLTELMLQMLLPLMLEFLSLHLSTIIEEGSTTAFSGLSTINDKMNEASEEILRMLETNLESRTQAISAKLLELENQKADREDLTAWKDTIDNLDLSGLGPDPSPDE